MGCERERESPASIKIFRVYKTHVKWSKYRLQNIKPWWPSSTSQLENVFTIVDILSIGRSDVTHVNAAPIKIEDKIERYCDIPLSIQNTIVSPIDIPSWINFALILLKYVFTCFHDNTPSKERIAMLSDRIWDNEL